ncbi:G-type lectin S-receptor-like serine/threonine-protein kinase At1g11410 [Impatiens glandulifera]|uniref:G-type lectin S-receptor-like serine/threonine-protein kinase At1g11410 n=1 Tax=Impatiens glandulifera TaxID=253017 RepID=UPI001FB0C421|nr:G-type lectin S-receptor-like serine/threonine-protein kinase At1g11410 [Impatiens glandulifera]
MAYIIGIFTSIALVIAILLMVFWFIMVKRREERKIKERQILLTPANGSSIQPSTTGKQPLEDFSFFKLSTIVAATNNFSVSNKLGQGGFGTVYKGRLRNGIDIAVKRLAKNSDQGFEEFKNEVSLIVKLQHRNLVRLLGCCFQPHEKMLIYEYLPNKGLDSFIFDQDKCYILNWEKRFNIILGIARGMIYLHQDSRLKIIHRDLKASNILLDDGLNPKISDFGTARVFGGDQMEANTKRVVGTYGYMSPEYAMEGLYSIKSDVFSFGVILLEIINGRKNTSYHQENTINLIGHAWALWNKGKVFDIIDSRMGDLWTNQEVLRCIHIGLLCVQEHAMDRPTMSEVVFMLCKDMSLPSPKQPAFIFNGQDMHASDSLTNIKDVVEIAVKRLAKRSHQGVEEFKNEVSLIAKFQHRNLVRLLGCCVEHHEKALVYEYLPNKDLDSFIFEKCSQLNWEKRYNIILGIAKGMVYLHQDSRLRIINRDLKTSNVLLDNELNPKISDFGMERIFKGNQIEANTNRVVGTIVYMSPEYSMEGLYSIKSDVFSFGVILLRIINRRKNTSYHQEKTINLISDVTKENNTFDFNDLLDGSEEVCKTNFINEDESSNKSIKNNQE